MGHWAFQLELPRPTTLDDFGEVSAIEGDTAIISDAVGGEPVAVLDRIGGDWGVTTTLAPPGLSLSDNFGRALALSGDLLAIGASGFDEPSIGSNSGAVWVYRRAGGVWGQGEQLNGFTGLAPGDALGLAVAADGATIAIGAPGATNGDVYIFAYTGNAWSLQEKLTGPAPGALFGRHLALSGDTLFVGSPNYHDGAVLDAGRVDIYARSGATWSLLETLALTTPSNNDRFGAGVDVDGDTLVIGDEGGVTSGRAHIFRFSGGTWSHSEATLPLFHTTGSSYLTDLAIDGDDLVLGDYNYDSGAGQILFYRRTGTTWTSAGFFVSPTPAFLTYFGDSVAVDGGRVVAGAPFTPNDGAAYVYSWVGERCSLDSACPTEFCSDLFCCTSRCGECGQCDATGSEGECTPKALGASDSDCGAYLCNGSDPTCPTSCANDGDCAATHHCEGGSCVPDGAPGDPCSSNTQCVSAFCVDGLCCDSACEEQCFACDVAESEGACRPVTGAPHGSRTSCPEDACMDGLAQAVFACDGVEAACQPTSETGCAPYRCGDDVCRGGCEVDEDCVGGFVCRNLECVVDDTQCEGSVITEPSGATVECAPYRCNDGDTCPTDCTTSAQCIEGYQCSTEGRCRERVEVPVSELGCACHLSRSRSSSAGWWLLGLAALARRRRQKR